MTFLQIPIPSEQVPPTPWLLVSAVIVMVMVLAGWLIRGLLNSQSSLALSIDKHMGSIAMSLGALVELSRLIMQEARTASETARDAASLALKEAREEIREQKKMRDEIRSGKTPPSS